MRKQREIENMKRDRLKSTAFAMRLVSYTAAKKIGSGSILEL